MTRKPLPHFFVRAFAALLLLAALLPAGSGPRPAYAASLTVTTLTDENVSNGTCSLREAIIAANTNANHNDCTGASYGNDTITFSVSGVITLTTTLPSIVSASTAGALTIDGSGQNITISGGGSVQVMYVNNSADLTLKNLTIANGGNAIFGGGVYNDRGTLTITGSTFSNNSADYGGGVYNFDGTLTITGSTFSGNSTSFGGSGGGVYNAGTLSITGSTFSGNSTSSDSFGNGGFGGGVFNYTGRALTITGSTFSGNSASGFFSGSGGGVYNDGGALTVTGSTFSGNSAGSSGGGVYNAGSAPTITGSTFSNNSAGSSGGGVYNAGGALTITGSTFSGNSASFGGGGVDNAGGALTVTGSTFSNNSASVGSGGGVRNTIGGTLTITNSTFSGNSAGFGGGVYVAGGALTVTNSTFSGNSASSSNGGGVHIAAGTATLKNTIIANSTSGGDCSGAFAAGSTNNMATDATCGSSFTQVTLMQLNLGNLTGAPAYFPLLPGSAAIDAGTNSGCPATDQRGVARPQGARCDIGAYEVPFLFLPLIMKN